MAAFCGMVGLGSDTEGWAALFVAVGVAVGGALGRGVGPASLVDVVDGVGVGVAVGVGDVATVSVVAHGSLAPQLWPWRAAAVVSFAPPGAAVATVAWNVAVAEVDVACVPSGGTVQVSALCVASSVRPRWASSPVLVAILALPSSPDRSSTTAAPPGTGRWLRAVSV
jgi:hypothetical protein